MDETEPAAIRALQTTSIGRYLAAYAADWAIIVTAYMIAARAHHFIVYAAAIFVIGTRQHALGVLAHDGAHGLISRNRTVNRILTEIGAWPLVVNVHGGYKEWHWEHHRELGTSDDPSSTATGACPRTGRR